MNIDEFLEMKDEKIKNPKMIIFDYGQTLMDEGVFDGVKGTEAVLREAAINPHNVSAKEVQDMANQLNQEIGRFHSDYEKQPILEVHNHIFQNYLYEYFGIELTKSPDEIEWIFWNGATLNNPTKNIEKFLEVLDKKKIRTSVISNISFGGKTLCKRINTYIPTHKFEFIIASSEYVFRKPNKRIFELALRRAKLGPGEVWYCGDNAVFDVDGAADYGIFPVWYKGAIHKSNKRLPRKECLEINDWNELVEFFI